MPQERPNVLLVIVDQWAGGRMGFAGHPVVDTSTIDQLARNGVVFSKAYSESPICVPARRTLMTGTEPRTHGDRIFDKVKTMPPFPTVARVFREAGYQAYGVGKLHVYPQRDRIGFDDVMLAEEGRPHLCVDDHDLYLAQRGFAGKQFMHGMSNNNYMHRPWHLPEDCHITNWATMEMCRIIKRRDPTRPAFWTLSYTHPHPPLVPLQCYMDFYRQFEVDEPLTASWSEDFEQLPYALKAVCNYWPVLKPPTLAEMRRAYYALCTHIDHQLRLVIATIREEKLLSNTILLICADHGDMLGDFGLHAKRTFYEGAARVPFVVVGLPGDSRVPAGQVDDRLVGVQDVMPTLLDLADLAVPDSCDGVSVLGSEKRDILHGEVLEDTNASRMVHDGRNKLIWYPAGNHVQLFDLETDPRELNDVANDPSYATTRASLEAALAERCYGADIEQGWVKDGTLVGFDPGPYVPKPDRTLSAQRGLHYPQPPYGTIPAPLGFPE